MMNNNQQNKRKKTQASSDLGFSRFRNDGREQEREYAVHKNAWKPEKARHGKSFKFSDFSSTAILTTLSVIVLAAAVLFAMFCHKQYMQNVRDNIAENYDSMLSASNDDETSDDSNTAEEFMTIEESDFDKEIEIPPSSIRDSKGNYLIEVLKDPDGAIVGANYSIYENDKLKYEKKYSEKSLLSSITEYLKKGKRLYEVVLDARGNFNGYSVTEYNDDVSISKKSIFAYGGALSEYFIYNYGENGALDRIDNYSSFDVLVNYTLYEYDEFGNNTSRLCYNASDALEYQEICTYDEYNRLIKEEMIMRNVCKSYSEYIYDENGDVEEHNYYLVDEYEMVYKEA